MYSHALSKNVMPAIERFVDDSDGVADARRIAEVVAADAEDRHGVGVFAEGPFRNPRCGGRRVRSGASRSRSGRKAGSETGDARQKSTPV